MRCLSVRQPWASLIVANIKDVENRSWEPMAAGRPYRGPLLIHAAMTWSKGAGEWLAEHFPGQGLASRFCRENLARGAIIGQVELTGVQQAHPSPWAEDGQVHWVLANAQVFGQPVPYPGRQGLFIAPEPTDHELFKPHDGRTRAVNLHHEPADVVITRPSMWGNPYRVIHGKTGWRVKPDPEPGLRFVDEAEAMARCLDLYRDHVLASDELMASLGSLRGKRLGCFCKPAPCHGDVLAELADGGEEEREKSFEGVE